MTTPAALAVLGEPVEVGPVGQAGPEVQSARGHVLDVGLRGVLAQAAEQQVAAGCELLAQAAQVGLPPGLGHDVEGGRLEQAADVHRLGAPVGQDAVTGRAAGDHRGDAEGRGHALGQRAQVDDVAGVVVGGDGRGRRW